MALTSTKKGEGRKEEKKEMAGHGERRERERERNRTDGRRKERAAAGRGRRKMTNGAGLADPRDPLLLADPIRKQLGERIGAGCLESLRAAARICTGIGGLQE